jgi:hypothetical protein
MNVRVGFPDSRRFYFTKLVEQGVSAEIASNGCKMEACKRLWNNHLNYCNGVFYILQDATLLSFKRNFKLLTNSDLLDNIPKTNKSQGIFLPVEIFNNSPAILDILAIIIRLLDLPQLFDSREELVEALKGRIIRKNGNSTVYYTKEVAKAIEIFDKFISKVKEDKRLDDWYAESVYGNFGLIYFLTIPEIRIIFLDESN